jgi:hypothetical protein
MTASWDSRTCVRTDSQKSAAVLADHLYAVKDSGPAVVEVLHGAVP